MARNNKLIRALHQGNFIYLYFGNGSLIGQFCLERYADMQDNNQLLSDIISAYEKYLKSLNS